MSRRSRGEASSLELLLDTMCNTFGGVMFIAISLFVVISAMEPKRPETPEPPPVPTEELREEISRLEKELRRHALRLETARREMALRQDGDPERRLRELALREEQLRERKLALSLHEAAVKNLTTAVRERAAELAKLREETALREAAAVRERHRLLELESELLKLAEQPALRRKLTFHVLRSDPRKPFYLLLRGDRVWPIGPWRRDGKDIPDEAVESREVMKTNHRTVICTIREDAGIPVLSGSDLSAAFRLLLGRLPADRVPSFSIPADSANTGFRLREILKQARIPHGWTPHLENDRQFEYYYTDHAQYEY